MWANGSIGLIQSIFDKQAYFYRKGLSPNRNNISDRLSPILTIFGHKVAHFKGTIRAEFYLVTLIGAWFVYWKVKVLEEILNCVIWEVGVVFI